MCRLFALHAGADPVAATFWLLDAPDSLREQSHREPDGAGIGVFDGAGKPVLDKQPIAAWEDAEFAREARNARSRTFIAHVRYASTGAHTVGNTHPFAQDGRLFAHNGAFGDLDRLDSRLDDLGVRSLVAGQTDSERMFALITAALSWISDNLPVFAVNLLLATPDELWALRYPQTHELYVLERPGTRGHLDVRSPRIRTHSRELSGAPSVIFASEPMDGETGWRLMDPGELVHVGPDLVVTSSHPLPAAPRHPLTLADLSPTAAASQGAAAQKTT